MMPFPPEVNYGSQVPFRTVALTQFEDIRDRRWVRKDEIWSVLFDKAWKMALAIASTIIVKGGAKTYH